MVKLALVCILIFCASISIKKISASRSKNIAWLSVNKHKAIVFKNGNAAIILTDLKDTAKAYRYSVQPYLDSCNVNNVGLFTLNQNINIQWMEKQGGLVQFFNRRAFLVNTQLAASFSPKLGVDYIYITGNPHMQLTAVNSNFDYRLLLMDGSNSDAYIDELKAGAVNNNIKYSVLKRNISLVTVSN